MEKKKWFIAYSFNMWIPVSIEGWTVLLSMIAGFTLIYYANDIGSNLDKNIELSEAIPLITEMLFVIFATYWVSKGHVDKRY